MDNAKPALARKRDPTMRYLQWASRMRSACLLRARLTNGPGMTIGFTLDDLEASTDARLEDSG
jgi:hypothetical protein